MFEDEAEPAGVIVVGDGDEIAPQVDEGPLENAHDVDAVANFENNEVFDNVDDNAHHPVPNHGNIDVMNIDNDNAHHHVPNLGNIDVTNNDEIEVADSKLDPNVDVAGDIVSGNDTEELVDVGTELKVAGDIVSGNDTEELVDVGPELKVAGDIVSGNDTGSVQ